jgi:hypothetical protein
LAILALHTVRIGHFLERAVWGSPVPYRRTVHWGLSTGRCGPRTVIDQLSLSWPSLIVLWEACSGGLPVPELCEGVYEPPSSRDTRAMKHASLVAFVFAALRCVVLRCVAPPPVGGVQPPL